MLKVNRKVQNLSIVLRNREHWLISARLCNVMDMVQSGDIKACSEKASHFSLNYQAIRFSFQARRFSMVDFIVNQSDDSFSALTSLADFSAAATADALKWTDWERNVVYQILSTSTVNTQHGQSVILSLQKDGGSSCSAWACGMLTEELLQNPDDDDELTVICGVNWTENEQVWQSVQFISTAAVLSVKIYFLSNIYIYLKMEFNSLFTRLAKGKA